MNHLDSELEDDDDELQLEEFRFHELLQRPVIHLFLVIIINNPINKFFTFITIFTIITIVVIIIIIVKVLHPFLVIIVMMVLLQFSGQGAVTFYTAQIFKVRVDFYFFMPLLISQKTANKLCGLQIHSPSEESCVGRHK